MNATIRPFGSARTLRRGSLGLAFGLLLSLGVSGVSAQAPLEIDILEEFLAEHDRVAGTPHCARHDGTFGPPGDHGTGTPAGGTNAILVEHKEWHQSHGLGMNISTDDADRGGVRFVDWHRYFLGKYEAFRNATGYAGVVSWNPADPMPPELAYPFPARACAEQNTDTRLPVPTWATFEGGQEPDPFFDHRALCDFKDINQLGKSIRGSYHIDVHRTYGDILMQDPRDPWFWSFHRFLDDLFASYETGCLAPTAEQGATPEDEVTEAPGPGLPLVLVGGAAAAWVAWRRPTSRSSRRRLR